jgi:hypothetical protein
MRQLIPRAVLPLTLLASVLASTPWLRSFPADVMLGPLFGAAILSVLFPLALARLGVRALWISALCDVAVLVLYELIVVLHNPAGFAALGSGLYHGPSQILTYALPLVSPRSLMVAPIALTWLGGAIAGECLARRWTSPVMHGAFLVCFGLAYAATVRGTTTVGGALLHREVPLAGVLLCTLLLLRAAQTWLQQDADAEATQADGVLPIRGVYAGIALAVVIALLSWGIVDKGVPTTQPTTPQRVPAIDSSEPVSPVSFVAGLRPADASVPGTDVFTMRTNATSTGYIEIANLDYYDGAGWSFNRTFRPSGGVLQPDPDTAVHAGTMVTQSYHLLSDTLSGKPWMPYLYRPQNVSGADVSADVNSGMIVPVVSLSSQDSYDVTSRVPEHTFGTIPPNSTPDTLTSAVNVQLPASLSTTLNKLVSTFSSETGIPSTPALPFLAALQADLQTHYVLSGGTNAAPPTPAATPTGAPTGSPSPTTSAPPPGATAGSSSFADVAASILGTSRTGTPEQYATLVALIARQLGVPARLATGFRVPTSNGVLPAGTYTITTRDAWTWVEIPIFGQGWVVLDAAPSATGAAPTQPTESASAAPQPTVTPTQNSSITKGEGNAVAPPSEVPSVHDSTTLIALIAVLGVAALAIIGVIAWLMRKPLRARRRSRAADPRDKVLGAWAESIDLLDESGLPGLDTLTSTEIADAARERYGPAGASAAQFIGDQANVAIFSTRTAVLESDAEDAWRAHRLLREEVKRNLGLRERIATRFRYRRPRD